MSKIDEDLYSRQIAVYGKNAMKSLTESKILILGYNGACLELCKNLILAGISKINLFIPDILLSIVLGILSESISKPMHSLLFFAMHCSFKI